MGCKMCWKFELATEEDDSDNISTCTKCGKIYLIIQNKKPDWINSEEFLDELHEFKGGQLYPTIESIFRIKAFIRKKWGDDIVEAIGFAVDRILVDRNIHADKVKQDIIEDFKKREKI